MDKFWQPIYIMILTIWICLPLIIFFQDSSLGASIYIGFCFFIAIISFNKKAFKQENTKKKSK